MILLTITYVHKLAKAYDITPMSKWGTCMYIYVGSILSHTSWCWFCDVFSRGFYEQADAIMSFNGIWKEEEEEEDKW